MNGSKRFIIIFLVLVVILGQTPIVGLACSQGNKNSALTGEIEYANYLDLDGDMIEDDVLTIASIHNLDHRRVVYSTYMLSVVTLPSGIRYHHLTFVEGNYATMRVTISWYGIATEPGWYIFDVYALVITSSGIFLIYLTLEFDPPDGGDPGPPLTGHAVIEDEVEIIEQ